MNDKKVLWLVEDEAAVRTSIAAAVENCFDVDVQQFADGRSVCAMLGRRGPGPSMMVVDVSLPDIDGITLALWVRRLHPDVPIVFFTGNPDLVGIDQLEALRPARVLGKPARFEELCAMLEISLPRRIEPPAKP